MTYRSKKRKKRSFKELARTGSRGDDDDGGGAALTTTASDIVSTGRANAVQ